MMEHSPYEPSVMPVDTQVSPEILKAVQVATQEFMDKVRALPPTMRRELREPVTQPKAWFADPYATMDGLGLGYRAAPSTITYETLRMVTERNSIIASIITTRANQVAAFSRRQRDKYSMGFRVKLRGPERRLTHAEQDRIEELTRFIEQTGIQANTDRDSFDTFLRKFVRDRLTYDQTCIEKVHTLGKRLHSFFVVPGDTIRIATPMTAKGTPLEVRELKSRLKYVQLIQGQIAAEFTSDELAFLVANPRTSLRVNNYGFPEPEMLITTVTSHLWAEEWNRRAFSQGSTIKGVLNLQGNVPQQKFEEFKRSWMAQIAGISNAWKTPLTNVEGLSFIPLQMNNTEMGYQMWMEYLVKLISAIYQIDPAEINFDLRGGVNQQPVFMSSNEAQQKISKDRGLQPLLRFIEDFINRHLIWPADDRFEFEFAGLDARTQEQVADLRMRQGQNYMTLNEVRDAEGFKPLPHGDVVMNPTYTGYLAQAGQQQMMQQQGGAPGGQPGGQPGAQQPDQPDPNDHPYQFTEPHGDEEKKGASRLQRFHDKGDEESNNQVPKSDPRWDSSVMHSSLRDNQRISKAQRRNDEPTIYDIIDLDGE